MLAHLLRSSASAVSMQLVLRKFITLGPSRNLELYLAQTVNDHRVLVWNPNINLIEIEVSYFLSFFILFVYSGYKSSIYRISYGYNLLSKMLSVPVWLNLSNFTRADNFSRLSLNRSHFEKVFQTKDCNLFTDHTTSLLLKENMKFDLLYNRS